MKKIGVIAIAAVMAVGSCSCRDALIIFAVFSVLVFVHSNSPFQ